MRYRLPWLPLPVCRRSPPAASYTPRKAWRLHLLLQLDACPSWAFISYSMSGSCSRHRTPSSRCNAIAASQNRKLSTMLDPRDKPLHPAQERLSKMLDSSMEPCVLSLPWTQLCACLQDHRFNEFRKPGVNPCVVTLSKDRHLPDRALDYARVAFQSAEHFQT